MSPAAKPRSAGRLLRLPHLTPSPCRQGSWRCGPRTKRQGRSPSPSGGRCRPPFPLESPHGAASAAAPGHTVPASSGSQISGRRRTRGPARPRSTPSSCTQRTSPRTGPFHPGRPGSLLAGGGSAAVEGSCWSRSCLGRRRGRRSVSGPRGSGRPAGSCGSNYYLPCSPCFTPRTAASGPGWCRSGRTACPGCSARTRSCRPRCWRRV